MRVRTTSGPPRLELSVFRFLWVAIWCLVGGFFISPWSIPVIIAGSLYLDD